MPSSGELSLAFSETVAFDRFEYCIFLVLTDAVCRLLTLPWWLVPLVCLVMFVPHILIAKRVLDFLVRLALVDSTCRYQPSWEAIEVED